MEPDYDVLVIGSGFGGSVTALRLTEKGYRVGVLEAGRRFADEEFAEDLLGPAQVPVGAALGCYGIQRIHLLRNVMILAGAGVGGGSLNYANTLYVPPEPFFADPQWAHITDWRAELMPYYEQAQRMLGVVTQPDVHRRRPDHERGRRRHGRRRHLRADAGRGVLRPEAEDARQTVPDPYFGGAGPERTGCIECGECMTGCRYGAKNTLVKNYLGLAESAGAQVHPMTTVTGFEQRPDGLWEVAHRAHRAAGCARQQRTFTADARGAGRRHLRHAEAAVQDARQGHAARAVRQARRADPHQLRVDRRRGTIRGRPDLDLTHGVAITSSIHPTPDTHVEPVATARAPTRWACCRR